jgi:hypothetical protein
VPAGKNPIWCGFGCPIGCGFGCEFVPVGAGLILNPTGFSRGHENVVPVPANPHARVCIYI